MNLGIQWMIIAFNIYHIIIFFMLFCSYYRFVLEPEIKFTEFGVAVKGPLAAFDHLPLKPLLTLGMDPPESWLVESVEALYDLDNICMEEVMITTFFS